MPAETVRPARAANDGGAQGKLLLVAQRLPFTIATRDDGGTITPSPGGLASALRGVHVAGRTTWLGHLGTSEDPGPWASRLAAQGAVPIRIDPRALAGAYDGFANGVLWPLFHYLIDKVNLDADDDWRCFQAVNATFADAVVAHYRPGDRIWVHDYQLALVPALVRARRPDAAIGFFLHIPFPSPDVFRILPWREEVVRGLLGADLVGFHTDAYARNFRACVGRVLPSAVGPSGVRIDGRDVQVGAFPVGVDSDAFSERAVDAHVLREIERLRSSIGERKLLLGVDRLDYTKGIPRRLLAFERLLETHPSLVGQVRYLQVAVPTRDAVAAYGDVRQAVAVHVARINGRFGTVDDLPVHFLHRSVSPATLVALYRAADVMMVTPLRDGMNLVAKEYVASRIDGDGALVLSELAGAADELGDALLVNPYDIGGIARALVAALSMSETERRHRMASMRKAVQAMPVRRWAQTFLAALARCDARDARV